MIVTLTPNPSLDLLFSAERLVWDDANRIAMPRRRAGGQGINVVRAARALEPGPVAHAIAPLGGPVGREIREMLESEGTPITVVPMAGDTRVFVGVREGETGRSLLLNPRGPAAGRVEADAMLAAVEGVLTTLPMDGEFRKAAPWFATCGSMLPGLSPDFYARAGELARGLGARFVPDCDGEALIAAAPGADLLVPNDLEAGRLAGRSVTDPASAVEAGLELLALGPGRVVITMGSAGAIAVEDEGAWWARPIAPPDRVGALARASAVGAGDAFLAALLQALDAEPVPVALASAVAAGTAVLLSEGAELVRRETVEVVRGWVEVQSVEM